MKAVAGVAHTVTGPQARRTLRWVWPALALLAFAGLGLAGYIVDEIAEGGAFGWDAAVLLALRTPGHLGDPIGPRWLLQSAIDLSALGGFTLLWIFGAVGIGYLLLRRMPAEAAWMAASLVGASIVDSLLKNLFHRARPDVVPHLTYVSNASFPSGHAMISAAVYLTLGLMLAESERRTVVRAYLLTFMCLLALLVGASRVFLGVHWPSDVVAGWCFGAVWALAVFFTNRWLRRARGP